MDKQKWGKIREFESLTSTNDKAGELVQRDEVREGEVILTFNQVQGRGQRGTYWLSEPGKNLTFSLVLKPNIKAEYQFFLNQVITLGIIDALKIYDHPENWYIKWPNDIYHKTRKIGGILIENALEGNKIQNAIAGIGLNINQKVFPDDVPHPASLATILGKEKNLRVLLNQISDKIGDWYDMFEQSAYDLIKTHYESHLYLKDQWHTFKDNQSGPFRAKLIGVESNGLLVLEKPSGERCRFTFKALVY